ncbi:COX15/CtaA family protein [Chloroflexi bacterium TSY]|nr:COX15/CtaA family protein [Chloroflexi bacterium TSY]
MMKRTSFALYVWTLLFYVVLVILWGAFVRATGSGAGCGSHWPLCNGEMIPRSLQMETIIEYTHRISSGLLGFLMLGMLVWAWRQYGGGHLVTKAALWSVFFVITEAAIGAGLVKFEWVATNDSMARVYTMAFHLINTFLLLTAVTLTGWFASGGIPFRLWGHGNLSWTYVLALCGMLILGASGAITALGDTLYLTAGITPDESPVVAMLVASRIYHPSLAFILLFLLILVRQNVLNRLGNGLALRFATWMLGLYALQLGIGGLNVYLKAPVWMQLVHLLLTDGIWILFILTGAVALVREIDQSVEVGAEQLNNSEADRIYGQSSIASSDLHSVH